MNQKLTTSTQNIMQNNNQNITERPYIEVDNISDELKEKLNNYMNLVLDYNEKIEQLSIIINDINNIKLNIDEMRKELNIQEENDR
jgi:hypothetical protein